MKALRLAAVIPMALLLLAQPACEGGGEDTVGTIDRETFIAVYVDLRTTAMTSGRGELDDVLRTEVLARHGVSEEDVTNFIEVHGQDVGFMQEVWDEIEVVLDTTHPPTDSVPGG